jgi:hypothetical protein
MAEPERSQSTMHVGGRDGRSGRVGAGSAGVGGGGGGGAGVLAGPEDVIREVFLSPRVVDQGAFSDLAGELRRLVADASAHAQALRAAGAEAQVARESLKDITTRSKPQVEAAIRAMQAVEGRASEAQGLLSTASASMSRLEQLREEIERQTDARVREAERAIEERVSAAARLLDERLIAAQRVLADRLAEGERSLSERVALVESRLAGEVASIEATAAAQRASLEARVADLTARMDEHTRGVGQTLNDRIDASSRAAAQASAEASARATQAAQDAARLSDEAAQRLSAAALDSARLLDDRAAETNRQIEYRMHDAREHCEALFRRVDTKQCETWTSAKDIHDRLEAMIARAQRVLGQDAAGATDAGAAEAAPSERADASGAGAVEAAPALAAREVSLSELVARLERERVEAQRVSEEASGRLRALAEQGELVRKQLGEAILSGADQVDHLRSMADELKLSISEALVTCDEAQSGLVSRHAEAKRALGEATGALDALRRAGGQLQGEFRELTTGIASARSAADSAGDAARLLIDRLSALLVELQPWRGVLLEDRAGGELPGPLAALLDELRARVGDELQAIAEHVQRLGRVGGAGRGDGFGRA